MEQNKLSSLQEDLSRVSRHISRYTTAKSNIEMLREDSLKKYRECENLRKEAFSSAVKGAEINNNFKTDYRDISQACETTAALYADITFLLIENEKVLKQYYKVADSIKTEIEKAKNSG